ncbi:MAG: heavy-metal-associated domain-containing protein [Magnetococcales bacterium]|nr:heavy-metal-associated domain-containing protein [Magnetococcales bacterium]
MTTDHQPHPVTHTLKVMEMVCPECDEIIEDAVSILDGVSEVNGDWRNNSVTVTYDLQQVRIQEVEKLLTEIGYPLDGGFLQRKKRDWIHFTEQNEIDNLNHVAHCCSKPPAGA